MGQTRTNQDDAEGQPRLSRQLILDTAIALVAQEGETALSMRRIAQELDVWPMSLYRYFHDKQTLLDALAEAAAEAIELPRAQGDWASEMYRLLGQVRKVLVSHPGGATLRLSGPELPEAAAGVCESGRELLQTAGLDPAEAQAAWQALADYVAGSAGSPPRQFAYGLELLLDALGSRAGAFPVSQR